MNVSRIVLCGALCCLLSGCATKPVSAIFKPAAPMCGQPKADAILVQVPKDERIKESPCPEAKRFLLFLPGVPYVHEPITPESYYLYSALVQYDFLKDIGVVVTNDLAAAGMAKSATYLDGCEQAEKAAPGTYYLKLEVLEGIWHRYETAYGLSFICIDLWVLGAPESYGHVQFEVQAELRDHDQKMLARETFKSAIALTEWYWWYGQQNRVPQSFAEAYGAISPRLREFVAKHLNAQITGDHQ